MSAVVAVALTAWPIATTSLGGRSPLALVGPCRRGAGRDRPAPWSGACGRFATRPPIGSSRGSSRNESRRSTIVLSARSTRWPSSGRRMRPAGRFDAVADAARAVDALDPLPTSCRADGLRRAGFQAAAAARAAVLAIASGARDRHGSRSTPSRSRCFRRGSPRGDCQATRASSRGTARHSRRGWSAIGRRSVARCCERTGESDHWRAPEMTGDPAAQFPLAHARGRLTSFKYRVVAGAVTSPTYEVTVVRPPRVTRIDVDYTYPAALGLRAAHRRGRRRHLRAGRHRRARSACTPIGRRPTGRLALGDGKPIALDARAPDARARRHAEGRRGRLLSRRAGRSRGPEEPRRHRVFHPHARGSSARRARR